MNQRVKYPYRIVAFLLVLSSMLRRGCAALLGAGLLLWAGVRARSRQAIIGWGLGAAAAFLVGGQALAAVTGLATGEIGPGGWQMALVLASLGVYTLALVVIAVGGVLLVGDLYRSPAGLGA